MKNNISFGRLGEDAAVDYLKKNGHKIICRNYKCKIGEIDIIAKKGKKLTFVEVKARSRNIFGGPVLAVNRAKQKKIIATALCYLKEKKLKPSEISFDIITILAGEAPEHIENAFSPGRFSY